MAATAPIPSAIAAGRRQTTSESTIRPATIATIAVRE